MGAIHLNNKTVIKIRLILLAVFLIAITAAAYLHLASGGGIPSVHALCPFGGLESLYSFFTKGSLIANIFAGTMALFFVSLLLTILFRRSFCGLICPFGAMQEFLGMLGRKLMGKQLKAPSKIDKYLRFLKYIILAVTLIYAFITAGLWMASFDPWVAYAHLGAGLANVWAMFPFGLILLFMTVIGSILYDRFLCKYLCPVGALYGIIGKLSPYKVTRNADSCTDCGICTKKCPMNIDVAVAAAVTSAECISCQVCVLNCPRNNTLEMRIAKRKVKPMVALILVMALFFIPIIIGQPVGAFAGEGGGMHMGDMQGGGMHMGNGQAGEPGMQNNNPGQQAGGLDFSGIMGRNTIKQAADIWGIDLQEAYKKLGIPDTVPADTMMKDIKNYVPSFNFEKLKGH